MDTYCEVSPTAMYIVDDVPIGNPRRKMSFVVSWGQRRLTASDVVWSESQTLEMVHNDPTCRLDGSEVVYTGAGMCIHTEVNMHSPQGNALPGTGTLGVFPRKGTGLWVSGTGWSSVSAYFGDMETPGWMIWNSTTPHPYTRPAVAPAFVADLNSSTVEGGDSVFKGFLVPQLSLAIGSTVWSRQGLFVPDYPFIDLPPDVYDAMWTAHQPNVHDRGHRRERWVHALASSTSVTLQLSGAAIPLDREALEVAWTTPDHIDDMKWLVFRRGEEGSQHIRFGCRPFRLNIFVDVEANTLSLMHVPDLERDHTFNTFVGFVGLSLLMVMYMSSAATRAVGRNGPSGTADAPAKRTLQHTLLGFIHQGREMEVIELAIAVVSMVVVWYNVTHLDMQERYAYLMFSSMDQAEVFTRVTLVSTWIAGSLQVCNIVIDAIIVGLAAAIRRRRKATAGAMHHDPLKAYSLAIRDASFGGLHRLLTFVGKALRTVSVPTTLFADSQFVGTGTFSVWAFHIKFREFCTHFLLVAAFTCTLVRGVRGGTNVQILAAVCIGGLYLTGVETGRLLCAAMEDFNKPSVFASSKVQLTMYIVMDGLCIVYMLLFLARPISVAVLPVFNAATLVVVCIVVSVGPYGGALMVTTRHTQKEGSKSV